jgi:predicted  nucleic acid-binding Zn-ribbon protein
MWRVWYEVTDEGDKTPEATMFKFKKKPTDAELEVVVSEFIAAKQDRKNKESELEELRIQVAQLEADLNL